MRVLLAGGGSAGHIEPALALADALRRVDPGAEVTCLGTERGLETRLIPLRGYPLELIPAVPMPRSVTPRLLTVPGRLAGAVNAAGFGAADSLREAGVQVLHIIGPRNGHDAPATKRGEGEAGGVPYVAAPYIDRMDLAYAAADFALCRAGAMTCAELTAVGLPAAYVPLPIGNGEQRLNALPIVQRGGGMLVTDADLSAEWIRDTLLPVLGNIDQVADMSEAAHSLGRGDADRWLAEAVLKVLNENHADAQ